jgi:uncharacterized membrane protein (Fun14 family)
MRQQVQEKIDLIAGKVDAATPYVVTGGVLGFSWMNAVEWALRIFIMLGVGVYWFWKARNEKKKHDQES